MKFLVTDASTGKGLFHLLAQSQVTAQSNAENDMKLYGRRDQAIIVTEAPDAPETPALERFGRDYLDGWFETDPCPRCGHLGLTHAAECA